MNKKVFNYKGVKTNVFGIPIKERMRDRRKKDSERIKSVYYTSFSYKFEKTSPKNLIVIYDIPQDKKKERDWFRRHLKKFDFIMIQKSVWVGPFPLPKDFLDYVKSIDLKDKFKTFKLARPYSENEGEIK
jgi:DNA-binding transcriptional regulator PaaX